MTDIDTQRCITLAGATRALAAAMEHADSLEVPVCVAVVDRGGNLVSFARMDGAPLMSAQLAQDKGYSVVAFKGLALGRLGDRREQHHEQGDGKVAHVGILRRPVSFAGKKRKCVGDRIRRRGSSAADRAGGCPWPRAREIRPSRP